MPKNPFVNSTHDPALRSWVPGAGEHPDFPIQNLPLCVFSTAGADRRGGVAIGEYILDLTVLAASGVVKGNALEVVQAAAGPTLNAYWGSTRPNATCCEPPFRGC